MANVPVRLFLILLLIFTTVLGCGTLPGGSMSSRTFNITGFCLPVAMVYSDSPTAAQVAEISRSADAARGFVTRTVLDVLEQQGRAAGLPDFTITSILNQLSVNIAYTPLECKRVEVIPMAAIDTMMMKPTCVIFGNTVTALCNEDMCMLNGGGANEMLSAVPSEQRSNLRNTLDFKHHNGKLVERHVAERGEQSSSSLGITSVWNAILLGGSHRLINENRL